MAGQRGELRVGLTISGAVALGAFEGGALAALIGAAQAVEAQRPGALRIDAMAGASAGSMTAVLAARTLLAGLDPIDVMYDAWVTTPALGRMGGRWRSPLDVGPTLEAAKRLLARDGANPRQAADVHVNMAMSSLHRLDYEIGRVGGAPVQASTFLDWETVTLTAAMTPEDYVSGGPMDAALASGAHAAAFLPRGLRRDAPDLQQRYRDNGIRDPPQFLWYTDGGTIDNEPLGRALDITIELDTDAADPLADARRLHLMITPDPPAPTPPHDAWTSADSRPRWAPTAFHVLTLLRSQHLYDDLRQLEKTNGQISWTRQLEHTLTEILEGRRTDADAALNEVIASIEQQKAALHGATNERVTVTQSDSAIAQALREALGLATGLGQKDYIDMTIVSPLVLPEVAAGTRTPRALLGGAFVGHFGGFLHQDLRENDFALGHRCMTQWMGGPDGLAAHGLDEQLAEQAVAAVDAVRAGHTWRTDLGGATLSSRPLKERLAVLRLAARAAVIAFNDVRRGTR
jgi:patatin-like phospholipase